jgi:hypothetical protein
LKIVDKILYIEFSDFLLAGWKEDTIKKNNFRNGEFWMMIENPADKRRPLVKFSELRPKDKEKLTAHFGNPYEYIAKAPIKKLVVTDAKAETFYTHYKFDGNKSLPLDHIKNYVTAASWLNMIIKCNEDKKYIKKELNLSLAAFYENVKAIIEADKIELPSSYKRLREKMKEYQDTGYACLIDWRFGNTNGVKVDDELSESILFEMIANPNQHDDAWVCLQYNAWAMRNDRKTITEATVGNYRRKNNAILVMQREGREAYYNKFSKSVKGFRPSAPLYLVESDDNHLDFFFVDWEDKTAHKFYHKFKAIVVIDSFNDYVLGYAFSQVLTPDTVKEAYLNAMYHIKELTGSWYLPHEVKTDRYAIGQLEPFYQGLGNYFKTPVGSKRRGYLEQFFGSTHWKRSMKFGTNNYTGNNITSINEGVNKEVLKLNASNYPTVQEAPQHIEAHFERLRLMPDAKGISKQAAWLAAFKNMPADKLKPISDMEFLLKLGTVRNELNTITDRGLDISINNKRYNYDIADEYYFEHKGCRVNTIYDPYDLSRVLITDFNRLRFLATAPTYQPRALADQQDGDRARLNAHLDGKQRHVDFVVKKQDERFDTIQNAGVDINALLTAGFVLKGDRQAAELSYQQNEMEQIQQAPPQKRLSSPIDKM